MKVRDEEGHPISSGEYISFSFGIPPISVLARINTEGGELWVNVVHPEDVKPKRERLANLMKWYQVYKANPARVSAYHREFRPGEKA